jgi:hypothetical protein
VAGGVAESIDVNSVNIGARRNRDQRQNNANTVNIAAIATSAIKNVALLACHGGCSPSRNVIEVRERSARSRVVDFAKRRCVTVMHEFSRG